MNVGRSWLGSLAMGTTAVMLLMGMALGASALVLQPSPQELFNLGLFLALSGGATVALAHGGVHLGRGAALRTFRSRILFVLLLATTLALANVAFLAKLMFISTHDLALLAILMGFALGLSAFAALVLSRSISGDITAIIQAARRMGAGDLSARVQSNDRGEIAEAAAALDRMAEQLEKAAAQKLEMEAARRELVVSISHDLRSPLASMRAMVESINDGVVTDPDVVRRYMSVLQSETEYLSRLIDDLFELSQMDAGLVRPIIENISLPDLISDTLQSVSA
ncbi:MAG: integral rane sensor signal transduction histidine kinase, partial [Dehalococcoidia bacterium]|nr:integral rane sensor signal transduction histidine kinase [Dehalococcoidia bacterium]